MEELRIDDAGAGGVRMIDCFLKSYNVDANVVEQVFGEIPGVAIILGGEKNKSRQKEQRKREAEF